MFSNFLKNLKIFLQILILIGCTSLFEHKIDTVHATPVNIVVVLHKDGKLLMTLFNVGTLAVIYEIHIERGLTLSYF